jgi:hypothetical protein
MTCSSYPFISVFYFWPRSVMLPPVLALARLAGLTPFASRCHAPGGSLVCPDGLGLNPIQTHM